MRAMPGIGFVLRICCFAFFVTKIDPDYSMNYDRKKFYSAGPLSLNTTVAKTRMPRSLL